MIKFLQSKSMREKGGRQNFVYKQNFYIKFYYFFTKSIMPLEHLFPHIRSQYEIKASTIVNSDVGPGHKKVQKKINVL